MMWNQHTITLTCCNWVQYLLPRRFSLLDCCCHFLILHLIAPKNKANFRGVEKTAPLHECISKFMCVQNIAWSLSTRLYIVLFLFLFIKKHGKYTHDTKKNMQHTKSEHKTQTILSVEMPLSGVLIKSNEWRNILQKLVSTYTLRPFCQTYENITQIQAIQQPGERVDLLGKANFSWKLSLGRVVSRNFGKNRLILVRTPSMHDPKKPRQDILSLSL